MEKCMNCGANLSPKNIRLATEDAGLPQDELAFYCPTYSDDSGCQGYCKGDEHLPAYWQAN